MGRVATLGLDLTGRFVSVPPVPVLPEGRMLELPGRGRTFVVDTGAPAGRPDAPALVLLHALACTGLLSWYPSLDALRARYRVITLDQRWHGRGIRSPHFRLEDCADDVAALADVLSLDRFVVVGYSMGSLVAQLVAHRHAGLVDGLVLGASTLRIRRGEADRLALRLLTPRALALAEGRLRTGPLAAPTADRSNANRWALAQFRSTGPAEITGATAVLSRFDSTAWAGRITAPAAVVITRKDRAIPPGQQRALARTLREASGYEIDSGHAAQVLDAARFTPALLAACASVTARRSPRGPR